MKKGEKDKTLSAKLTYAKMINWQLIFGARESQPQAIGGVQLLKEFISGEVAKR